MTYNASLDKFAKGVTIGATLLFVFVIIEQFTITRETGRTVPICITIALLFIYFITFAFRPINYKVSTDKLIIHRLLIDVKIDRNQIKSIELLDKEKWVSLFGLLELVAYLVIMEKLQIEKLEIWTGMQQEETGLY